MDELKISNIEDMAGATQATVRGRNQRLVLGLIEEKGPLSRADLVKLTEISAPTVSSIVDDLVAQELVKELKPGPSSGGRKPIPLKFNGLRGYVIGIDVGGTNIEIGIADLAGKFKERSTFASEQIGQGLTAVEGLAELTHKMIADSKVRAENILGCGVVVPGVTDVNTGVVSLAPAFGWQNMPLKDILADRLNLPIYLENDVNAAAFAEKKYGQGKEYSDFIFISVGTGIGAGLIINNRLHRGYNFAAGEVGYTIVDMDWIKNNGHCDKRYTQDFGCLESLASAPAVVDLAEELGLPEDFNSAHRIIAEAKEGNRSARQVLARITDYLAAGIINASLIVSPEAVFLGGGIFESGDILLEPIRQKIYLSSPLKLKLAVSSFGSLASLKGAATIAAREVKFTLLE